MDEPHGVNEADKHLVGPIDEPRARPDRPGESAAAKHSSGGCGGDPLADVRIHPVIASDVASGRRDIELKKFSAGFPVAPKPLLRLA